MLPKQKVIMIIIKLESKMTSHKLRITEASSLINNHDTTWNNT